MLVLVIGVLFLAGCEDNGANGKTASNLEKALKTCWTCSLFKAVYDAAMGLPGGIIKSVASGAIGLVGVFYGLWLAVFILKYVAAVHEQEVGAFWKGIASQTFWVVMGVALLKGMSGGGGEVLDYAKTIFEGFVNAGLAIVGSSGAGLSSGGGLVGVVGALQEKLNFSSGLSATAMTSGDPFAMFAGVVIFIVSVVLMIYVPMLLLDVVFRYAVALCMLPMAVAAYVFAPTRSFSGTVGKLLLEVGFYVVGMCAYAACCVQIIQDYTDKFLPFVKNPGMLFNDPVKMAAVLMGPGITGLIFLCFFLVLFAGVMGDFMNALSGGAGGMGETAKGTVAAIKKMAQTAKKIANFGINRVKRARDKKAAKDLESKPEGSKERQAAVNRLRERGYLAEGKDGKLHATASYDNLMRNEKMKGPFKTLRRLGNDIQDLHKDLNQSAMAQTAERHGSYENSKFDDYKGKLEDAGGSDASAETPKSK